MHNSEFGNAGLTGLTDLDLFGARITDFGTNYLKSMQFITKYFTSALLFVDMLIITFFRQYDFLFFFSSLFVFLIFIGQIEDVLAFLYSQIT